MPTIISGLDPSVRMNAYLAGQKFQTHLQEQQAEEMREAARQRQELIRTMQGFRAQQTKALEDVNARAQMGEVQALIQQEIEARAANMPPDQKRLQEFGKLRGQIDDPKALDELDKAFIGLEKRIKEAEELKAAEGVIQKGIQDGVIDNEAYQAELQSGARPQDIAKRITVEAQKKNAAAVAMNENEEFAAQAEELVKSAPKGTKSARRAMFILQEYFNSPTDQQSPGAGARLKRRVQEALIMEADEERQLKREKKRRLEGVVPGTGGKNLADFKEMVEGQTPTLGVISPETPPMSSDYADFAGKLKAEKERRYPGSTKALKGQAQSAPQDPASAAQAIIAQMRAEGIPITPENLQAVKARLRGQGAAPAGAQ